MSMPQLPGHEVRVEIQPHPSKRTSEQLLQERRDLIHALGAAMMEMRQMEEELYSDSLTGISNRKKFDKEFAKLVDVAHTSGEPLALLVADVDGLKRTNDTLGHTKGDALLQKVGKAFKTVARDTDVVGRFGGDEFYGILPGFIPLEGKNQEELFNQTKNRYQQAFDNAIHELDLPEDMKVGVSFGVGILQPGESAEEFFGRVDALSQADKNAKKAAMVQEGIAYHDDRLVS